MIVTDRLELLGQRTAEMHMALASNSDFKGFESEDFSLHYQRSLYSSLQSSVREHFSALEKNQTHLSDFAQSEAQKIITRKKEILECLKRIFSEKFDTTKIRTHGDYHLSKILFTGKDFYIIDFEGKHFRSFSEQRLRRTPLRDVSSLIRSLAYAVYQGAEDFYKEGDTEYNQFVDEWADKWFQLMAGLFLKGYMDLAKNQPFIPNEKHQFNILLETFSLQQAVAEIKAVISEKPDYLNVPVKGIELILKRYKG